MVAGRICGPCTFVVEGDSQLAAAHAKTPSTITLGRVFTGDGKPLNSDCCGCAQGIICTAHGHSMNSLRANQALVADEILLDGRLALYHQTERWLAVADLHFGYELSQRAAGRLVLMWGMASISERLMRVVEEYAPLCLIVLGDLVHDKTAAREAAQLLGEIARRCEVVVVAGNHDRQLGGHIELVESWRTDRFHFHHGHFAADAAGRIRSE